MHDLERYAREKELDKDAIKIAVLKLHRMGMLDEQILSIAIEKSFILGHNAGHCRGEAHTLKIRQEMHG